MFQFPRFPLPVLYIQTGVTPHDGCWVAPFGYLRIEAWSAAPRSFSQPPTSFIGFRRQGIHRWLFVAWRIKDARARYEVLKSRRRIGAEGALIRRNRQAVSAEGAGIAFSPGRKMPPPEGSGRPTSRQRAQRAQKTEQRQTRNIRRGRPGVGRKTSSLRRRETLRSGGSTSDQLGVLEGRNLASETPYRAVRLLRKEVIQPHLPVRLPCYDFTPIADPTFDGSPPYGLGHRLRVLPTFVV